MCVQSRLHTIFLYNSEEPERLPINLWIALILLPFNFYNFKSENFPIFSVGTEKMYLISIPLCK